MSPRRFVQVGWLAFSLLAAALPAFADTVAGDACTSGQEHYFKRSGGPETSGIGYVLY